MEGWAKVYVGGEGGRAFLDDEIHGRFECVECHGGASGVLTKDAAHVGMVADPSEGPQDKCASLCHAREMGHFWTDSVHATQVGYLELFEARAGVPIEGHPAFEAGFQKGCSNCHASCGDCHISQPKNVGGGLIRGHQFSRKPDRARNCMACHGSRVGDEFTGANSYAGADVHWIPGLMHCVDCHGGAEMHGTKGAAPKHRYEEPAMPRCEDCHNAELTENWRNDWHDRHASDAAKASGRNLQCQVCHSQTYKSCNSCHVGEGITGASYPTFKIGRNPIAHLRDYDYVLLRHIPVSEDTFEGWGLEALEHYAAVETWKYTSPHAIRKHTAATAMGDRATGCASCHDTADSPQGLFLRASDLSGLPSAEQQANQNVIVPDGHPFTWPD